MRNLSIFVDESGTFGPYKHHSPFYIVTLVFHDQSVDISSNLNRLRDAMKQRGLPDYTVHAGPLIRRDDEYRDFIGEERKVIFDYLFNFVRTVDIKYHPIHVEKKHLDDEVDLVFRITKQLSAFLNEHLKEFLSYDKIIVYYDYGQKELSKILVSVFNAILSNVNIKKVAPANYKLFQATDMLCTLELLSIKANRKMLTNSELTFFFVRKMSQKVLFTSIKEEALWE